jgi:HSP20 family protein
MMNTGTAIAAARHSVMQNRLNRLFDETFGPFNTQAPISEDPGAFTTWTPLCDIYETDKNIVIKTELPEVKRENVSVTFDNNVLTISGERKVEEEEGKGQRYHRQERIYGHFLRTFTLPPFVDTKKITAESKEGMLLVTLPKVEEAKAKQIEVKVE